MKYLYTVFILLSVTVLFAQPSGSLDPTFGVGGKVLTQVSVGQDAANAVALQSDEKIVVIGYSSSNITGKDFTCIRYNTSGSLDSTFGIKGVATFDIQLGSDDVANSIQIQQDGKIVIAGSSDDGTDRDATIIRLNTDGTLDNSFGNNGIVLTDFENAQQDEVNVLKLHPLTGKIIVGGYSQINTSKSKPVVARYLNNGTLDTSFNHTGIKTLWITNLDYQYFFSIEDMVVQSNGKISVIGWRDFPTSSWDSDYWAGRINTNGSMDVSFSSDGVMIYNGTFNGHDRAYSLSILPNGNFIGTGGSYRSSLHYDMTLFELNAGGGYRQTIQAVTFSDYPNGNDIGYALQATASGDWVIGGSSGSSVNSKFTVTKLSNRGALDQQFGVGGKVTTAFDNNAVNECFDIAIQSDEKIVAVGYSDNKFAIARYLGKDQAQLENFQLTSPANLSRSINYASIILDWTDAYGATGYELEFDTVPSFNSSPRQINVAASSTRISNLIPNQKYYWRVRSTDGTIMGPYSNSWEFTTNSLENFTLVQPSNTSMFRDYVSLTFDWTTAVGATRYELEIDSSSNFSTGSRVVVAATSSYTFSNLISNTTYYWRVRASNNGISYGQWSTVWRFTTKAAPNTTGILDLTFNSFSFYPNPVISGENIIFKSDVDIVQVRLFDMTGRLVHRFIGMNSKVIQIPSSVTAGVYVLMANDKEGNAVNRKLQVN